MTFYRRGERIVSYSYREMWLEIERRVNWLISLGVTSGDRVALLSPNDPEVPLFTLALMNLGATSVPLNPNSAAGDWEFILRHSEAKGLLVAPELMQRTAELHQSAPGFVASLAQVPLVVPSQTSREASRAMASDISVILYTSGTTARPKGVALTHRNLMFNVTRMASHFGLDGTTQLSVLPLYHAHAFNFGLMTALLTGGHFVFTERFDPFTWAQVINDEKVEVTSAFPTILPLIRQTGVNAETVPSLRCVMVTSSPLPSAVARSFETNVGIPLMHGWGLTESTCLSTCVELDLTQPEHDQVMYGWKVPSIGTPLTDIEVAVFDDAGNRAGPEQPGELKIRGNTLMSGYFHDTEATEAAIQDGWFHTGDEGFFVEVKNKPYFFITGRLKELIIKGGQNFSPMALEESIFARLPELRGKLTILGFQHDLYGEEIGIYLCDPEGRFSHDALIDAVQALPALARPGVVVCGSAPIPQTHTGKVQRRKLQELFAGHRDCAGRTKFVSVAVGDRREARLFSVQRRLS
jgi:long-chain acyl-CoA synthetase